MSMQLVAISADVIFCKMGDFEVITEFGNLYKGLKASCRNVRWKDSTVGYEANALKNTYRLRQSLLDGTYKIQPYQTFQVYEPKERTIVATRMRDRQFQHALVDEVVYEQLTRSFIVENCACMRGRGVDYCLNRVTKTLTDYYRKNGCEGWVYKFDIQKYFDSIPHDQAKRVIRKRIKDPRVQRELFRIVDSYPGDRGLGLGSQVNQLLALALLDELDHYIKEKLRVKHYVRYMDDFILIHPDKGFLKECAVDIERKINGLGLSLSKKKTVLLPLRQGFEMLKWTFMLKPSGKVIRKMNRSKIRKQKKKITKLWELEKAGKRKPGTCDVSMQSFMANTRRGDTYSERREMAQFYYELTGRKYHDYVKFRGTGLETGGNRFQKPDGTGYCDGKCGVYCEYVRYCTVPSVGKRKGV